MVNCFAVQILNTCNCKMNCFLIPSILRWIIKHFFLYLCYNFVFYRNTFKLPGSKSYKKLSKKYSKNFSTVCKILKLHLAVKPLRSIFNRWQKCKSATSYLKNIQNEKYGTPHGPFPFMVGSTTAKNPLPLTSLLLFFPWSSQTLKSSSDLRPVQFSVLLGKENYTI